MVLPLWMPIKQHSHSVSIALASWVWPGWFEAGQLITIDSGRFMQLTPRSVSGLGLGFKQDFGGLGRLLLMSMQ
jgi:hypothetical protein